MKFAIIIPCQKFYPATLKLLNYFWLQSGRKCWNSTKFVVFPLIWLKFGVRVNLRG